MVEVQKNIMVANKVVNIANFKKNWDKYCNKEISFIELRSKYKMSAWSIYKCRDIIYGNDLPIKSKHFKDALSTFKEDYMKYYNGHLTRKELYNKYEISKTTFRSWRTRCNLPKLNPKTAGIKKIPKNFEELYMKFYNGEISQKELLKECHVSATTLYKWRDQYNLPNKYSGIVNSVLKNSNMVETSAHDKSKVDSKELFYDLPAKIIKDINSYSLPKKFRIMYEEYLTGSSTLEGLCAKHKTKCNNFFKQMYKYGLPAKSYYQQSPPKQFIENFKKGYEDLMNKQITSMDFMNHFTTYPLIFRKWIMEALSPIRIIRKKKRVQIIVKSAELVSAEVSSSEEKNNLKDVIGKDATDREQREDAMPWKDFYVRRNDKNCLKILLHFNDLYMNGLVSETTFPKKLMTTMITHTIYPCTITAINLTEIQTKYKEEHPYPYEELSNLFKKYFEKYPYSFNLWTTEPLPSGISLNNNFISYNKNCSEKLKQILREYTSLFQEGDFFKKTGIPASVINYYKECNIPLEVQIQVLLGLGVSNHEILNIIKESYCIEEKEYIEPTTVSAEPPVQQITPVKEHTFSFNLFGHQLTIRNPFKVEKIEPPISVNLSDEFPDEVEY